MTKMNQRDTILYNRLMVDFLVNHIGLLQDRIELLEDELMPLTKKGKKIKRAMTKEYGKKKGTKVFYASKNAKKIKGVD